MLYRFRVVGLASVKYQWATLKICLWKETIKLRRKMFVFYICLLFITGRRVIDGLNGKNWNIFEVLVWWIVVGFVSINDIEDVSCVWDESKFVIFNKWSVVKLIDSSKLLIEVVSIVETTVLISIRLVVNGDKVLVVVEEIDWRLNAITNKI